jgi:hypothetical protein
MGQPSMTAGSAEVRHGTQPKTSSSLWQNHAQQSRRLHLAAMAKQVAAVAAAMAAAAAVKQRLQRHGRGGVWQQQ